MNEPVPAVPQLVILQDFARDPTLPTDDSPVLTVLLPLALVLAVFLAVVITAVVGEPQLLLRDDLGLGRGEEDLQWLSEADGQANERDERDVQRPRLDLLKVLPVYIASFGSFFERPVSRMAQGTDPSAEGSLLLLEASSGSVGLGRSLGLGGGHTARTSGVRLARDTSHMTSFVLTSLVPTKIIGSWAYIAPPAAR